MKLKHALYLSVAVAAFSALAAVPSPVRAQTAAVVIDSDDIGGVVTGPNGPEAGVWVIAETNDLPTKFAKIVVTDAQGRYVIPDLPKGNYTVWVRGYGLVDSPKVTAAPGKLLNLTATVGAERCRGGGILSRHVLVLDAEDPGGERVSRHRTARQRHPALHEDARRLDRYGQEFLPVVPCVRLQGRPHHFAGARPVQEFRARPGSAASSPARP